MIASFLALATLCNADRIFQTSWLDNNACGGAPTTMVTFDDALKTTELSHFMLEEFAPPICGINPLVMENGCCIQSLDISNSLKYSSMSLHYSDDPSTAQAPVSANEASYCHFTADGTNSSLLGLQEIYFLASSICIDEFVKCSPSGQFSIYPEPDCQGSPVVYSLSPTPTDLTVDIYGSLVGDFVQISGGTIQFKWLQFIPSRLLVPNWQYPMEFVGIIAGTASLAIGFIMIGIFARIFYIKRRWIDLSFAIYYGLWLCDVILTLAYWTIIYASTDQWEILLQFQTSVFNISRYNFIKGSLWTVFISNHVIFEFYHLEGSVKYKLSIIALLVIHFVFAGADYMELWRATADQEYRVPLNTWAFLHPIWVLFMFVFDSIPPIYLIHKMAQGDQRARNELSIQPSYVRLYTKHRSIAILMVGQLVNTVLYISFAYLTGYSQVMANDRNMLAMTCVFCLIDVVHSVITTMLVREIKIIISDIKKFGAKRKNTTKSLRIRSNGKRSRSNSHKKAKTGTSSKISKIPEESNAENTKPKEKK